MHVLCAHGDVGAGERRLHAGQRHVGRADHALGGGERDQTIFDGVDKGYGFLGGLVHLPVAGDDGLAHEGIASNG